MKQNFIYNRFIYDGRKHLYSWNHKKIKPRFSIKPQFQGRLEEIENVFLIY